MSQTRASASVLLLLLHLATLWLSQAAHKRKKKILLCDSNCRAAAYTRWAARNEEKKKIKTIGRNRKNARSTIQRPVKHIRRGRMNSSSSILFSHRGVFVHSFRIIPYDRYRVITLWEAIKDGQQNSNNNNNVSYQLWPYNHIESRIETKMVAVHV